MINDLKLGLKILRYAYGIKMSLVSGILFLLLSVVNIWLSLDFAGNTVRANNIMMGGVMMACTVLLTVQLIHSLNASNLIQVSPRKKRMQTSIPAVLSVGGMGVMYLLNALIFYLIGIWRPESMVGISTGLVLIALVMALMMMYMGAAYKYFLAASLIFYPILFAIIYTSVDSEWFLSLFALDTIPFMAALFIGLAIVIAGGLVQYLLSLAVYKAPMSKMAQTGPLRKEL